MFKFCCTDTHFWTPPILEVRIHFMKSKNIHLIFFSIELKKIKYIKKWHYNSNWNKNFLRGSLHVNTATS